MIKYYNGISFKSIADINLYDSDFNPDQLNNKSKLIILTKHSNSIFNRIIVEILPLIKVPFVIISILEDGIFPNHFDNLNIIYENIYFKHLFTINSIIPNNDKITNLPYGLNYHTAGNNFDVYLNQDQYMSMLANNMEHFSKRDPRIYCNFQLSLTDIDINERCRILNYINPDLLIIQNYRIEKNIYLQNICNFSFILSPKGHGYDCIRTFEGLVLGCIPILKRNELNLDMYNDLPVLIVDEWTDITKELLDKTIIEFSNKTFNYEKLTMNYYINLINNYL